MKRTHTWCSDSLHVFGNSGDIGLVRRSDGCWVDWCVLWGGSSGRILLVLNVKIRRSYRQSENKSVMQGMPSLTDQAYLIADP